MKLAKSPDQDQHEILKNHYDKIEWLNDLEDLENKPSEGLVISNEFFDALPFHRLKQQDGSLKEIFVDIEDEKLVETLQNPSYDKLISYRELYAPDLADSQEIEINLEARKTIDSIRKVLDRGIALNN